MPFGRATLSLRRTCFVAALALLIALQSATPAWAWGRLGHRVMTGIAKKHLTPKARDAIARLRLYRAGVRLAMVLNDVFPDK